MFFGFVHWCAALAPPSKISLVILIGTSNGLYLGPVVLIYHQDPCSNAFAEVKRHLYFGKDDCLLQLGSRYFRKQFFSNLLINQTRHYLRQESILKALSAKLSISSQLPDNDQVVVERFPLPLCTLLEYYLVDLNVLVASYMSPDFLNNICLTLLGVISNLLCHVAHHIGPL